MVFSEGILLGFLNTNPKFLNLSFGNTSARVLMSYPMVYPIQPKVGFTIYPRLFANPISQEIGFLSRNKQTMDSVF